jgi:glycosyltransferase involved in cell wall biosynthesis
MRVQVLLEQVFQRSPDGSVVTGSSFHAGFFQRYLTVFDAVEVIARVDDTGTIAAGCKTVEDHGITVRPIPFYHGLSGFLRQRGRVLARLHEIMDSDGALILRVPSPLAASIHGLLQRTGRRFAVEVVGDPWDVFARGAIRHPLRPWLRWYFRRSQRQQCQEAVAACYVTHEALQRRYPVREGIPVFSASSIQLDQQAFRSEPRTWHRPPVPLRLIMVGTLAQLYKAPDILITAVGICNKRSFPLHLDIIGDGMYRSQLERMTGDLGLRTSIRFLGHLPAGATVRDHLDRADVFVLPSYQEGLPRAMIEAMARGLPCLGSTAGGIPELLERDEVVEPGDAGRLADLLMRRTSDLTWLNAASARNLARAARYRDDINLAKHRAFLEAVSSAML